MQNGPEVESGLEVSSWFRMRFGKMDLDVQWLFCAAWKHALCVFLFFIGKGSKL